MDKPRCQSCGMPLGTGFYGSNTDESESSEYCKYCFQKGSFVEPSLSVNDMIEKSISHMTNELHTPIDEAIALANSFIPTLKRWKN